MAGDVITDAGGTDRDYFYAGVNFLCSTKGMGIPTGGGHYEET